MDIHKFRKDFERSGLTQRAYGESISMSPSMVHYYLGKTKLVCNVPEIKAKKFTPLEISVQSSDRSITITTPAGVQINIPI